MKTKLSLFIFALLTCIVLIFFLKFGAINEVQAKTKVGMKPIKCTSTNFLLDEIDSTKQVSPLFENLGAHEFKINTNS